MLIKFLLLFSLTLPIYANTFLPNQIVLSSEINSQFQRINDNLKIRDIEGLDFDTFSKGEVIDLVKINFNLQKIKNKYPQAIISLFSGNNITALQFNQIFTQAYEESILISHKDCSDIQERGLSIGSGNYIIFDADFNRINVECDMTTAGGGWTKVWHGYPSEAKFNINTNNKVNISNKLKFNQMRVENVNINKNEYDFIDFGLASLNQTIPYYYNALNSIPDASSPRIKFHDENNSLTKELSSNRFFYGYGNGWRMFSSCINVSTSSLIYLGGTETTPCNISQYFNQHSIPDCTSENRFYCENAMTSNNRDTKGNLTLKELQESAVWIRKIPILNSCKDYLDNGLSTGDGFYIIKPNGVEIKTYCDMTTDGGGWTLVWSNLRGGTNKPTTDLTDSVSRTTLPRCSANNTSANDRTGNCSIAKNTAGRFINYFIGLNHWNHIGKNTQMEIRYEWSALDGNINQSMKANLQPFSGTTYAIVMSNNTMLRGSIVPGLFSYHNNRSWTTYNADRDLHNINCGNSYSRTPFWYNACWDGSINGGGERTENGYVNGAYWKGSNTYFATNATSSTGLGGGNGWMWIRHK